MMMTRVEIGPFFDKMKSQGWSHGEIAKQLADMKVKTATGLEWTESSVASIARTGAYWPDKISPFGHSTAHHVSMEEPPEFMGQLGPWIETQIRKGFNQTQIAQQLNFFKRSAARSKVWSATMVGSIVKNHKIGPYGKRPASVYYSAPASQLELNDQLPMVSADPRTESLRLLLSNGPMASESTSTTAMDDYDQHRIHCASVIASGLVQRVDMFEAQSIAKVAIDIITAIENLHVSNDVR